MESGTSVGLEQLELEQTITKYELSNQGVTYKEYV
jgi:hypothetical protein